MTNGFHRFARKAALALVLGLLGFAGSGLAHERAQAPDGQGGVTLIAAGGQNTCALRPDGQAVCWGENVYDQSRPPAGERFVQLKNGSLLACGLRADGRARCWGHNSYTAVPVGYEFRSIAVGYNFACGLGIDGLTTCWGDNSQGQATPPPNETFVAIEAGFMFACGLRADGSVGCWGSNSGGQTLPPTGGASFTALALGSMHACGLRAVGGLQCWGNNAYGQATPPTGISFVSLTAGMDHTCGLLANGTAQCWGYNGAGESTVPAGQTFIAISAGRNHTCGVRQGGAPLCWGSDGSGQLGASLGKAFTTVDVGNGFACGTSNSLSNTNTLCWGNRGYGQAPAPSEYFAVISTGGSHACALRYDATMRCWGRNDFGQATAPSGTFAEVSAGDTHTCARRSDNTLQCWGNTANGRTAAPSGAFNQVATGVNHACALRANGTVACWGGNPYGAATAPSGTFVQLASADWFSCGLRSDRSVECWGGFYWSVPPGAGYMELVAGRAQVCARHSDGSVRCGGVDQFGQASAPSGVFTAIAAGDDTSCGILSNNRKVVCWGRQPLPEEAEGPFGIGALALGWQHSCNLSASGRASCWGENGEGQSIDLAGRYTELDVGERNTCMLSANGVVWCSGRNVEDQGTPATGPFKALRMAPYGGCALRPNGSAACWGLNNYGQATPPAGTYRAIDAGYFHGCAIDANAAAVCWGLNSEGQGTAPGGPFRDIAVGDYHSCALRMDGTLACWGRNADGQATPPAGSFNAFAAGRFHGCAIRTDGTLACWGANEAGQSTPPATGRYSAVSAGMSHSCAIRDDGARVCWGSNVLGANPDLVLSPATLPDGILGSAYGSTQLAVAGANYTPSVIAYGITVGGMPPGLSLSAAGVLSGTPTTVGTYAFTVEGEDELGFIATREYTLVIADPTPPVITSTLSGIGNNGWFITNVGIAWSVSDAQSAITSSTGCTSSTLSTDSLGAGYTCTATSAGGTSTETVTVKRDATAPVVVTTTPGAVANAAGWYAAPITVHHDCSDETSGVANCPSDETISTEGSAVQTIRRYATDFAGNGGPSGTLTLAIDLTAPQTSLDFAPPAQSDSVDATFAFSATDALSGIDALECSVDGAAFVDCASPLSLTGLADGAHSFAVRARDVAGNLDASPATHAWTIDTDDTPPVIAPVVSGTLGDNGWYIGDVTIAWNVSDADSAIGSSSGCNTVVLSTDTPAATFTCTASSIGGSASDSVTVKLDKSAPQLVAAPTTAANAAGWYRDDVTIGYACSDALSGVATCPADQVLGGAGSAVTSAARTARDAAGNVSAPATATVKIDRTAPTLAPTVAQPLLLNAVAAAQANASDGLSGIATQSCTALSTSSVGARTVTCTTTDAAGNSANASTGYRVQYGFAGFEAPLDHAWNGVQAKKYLPFAWRVFDANNADVIGIAKVTFAKANVTCPAGITPVPLTAYGDANTALQYLGGGRYRQNWLMPVMLRGCIHLTVDLGDGVPHVLQVKL